MQALDHHQSRQIAVVAVTGPKSSGKSFLCNCLVDMKNEFPTGGDGTDGIWMWSELIPLPAKDGSDSGVDLLLLDTAGLNSEIRGFDFDVKLFTLTVLLSSTLVYNQRGSISDESLDNLVFLQMMQSQIKFKNLYETATDFAQLFPEFYWVLRDFSLGFKHLTPESYLEQCLEQEKVIIEGSQQKNQIRALLKKYFPKIECFQIVCPAAAGQEAALPMMSLSSMNQDFVAQFNHLKEKLFSLAPKVKTINGRPLSGYMLLGMALEYVDSLNKQEPPVILQCFERIVTIESERFLEQLYEDTVQRIHARFDFNPQPQK